MLIIQKVRNEAVDATRKATSAAEKTKKLILEAKGKFDALEKLYEENVAKAEELAKASQLAEQKVTAAFASWEKEATGVSSLPQVSFSQGLGQLQVCVPLAGHLPPDQSGLLAQVAAKCRAETLAVLGLEKHYTLEQA